MLARCAKDNCRCTQPPPGPASAASPPAPAAAALLPCWSSSCRESKAHTWAARISWLAVLLEGYRAAVGSCVRRVLVPSGFKMTSCKSTSTSTYTKVGSEYHM
jgi:hypothetical protein